MKEVGEESGGVSVYYVYDYLMCTTIGFSEIYGESSSFDKSKQQISN